MLTGKRRLRENLNLYGNSKQPRNIFSEKINLKIKEQTELRVEKYFKNNFKLDFYR
jgi:hypothetical protein